MKILFPARLLPEGSSLAGFFFATLLAAVILFSAGCKTAGATSKPVASREVFIVSGGFNAAYGHNAIRIKPNVVEIDTSFYPAGTGFDYKIDSVYLRKNRTFSRDLQAPVNARPIYSRLVSLPLDSLKAYESRSHQYEEEGGYFIQPVEVTQNGKKYSFDFYLPSKDPVGTEPYDQFLLDMKRLFPFGAHNTKRCLEFYRNYYK
jgi:hypothetical protein